MKYKLIAPINENWSPIEQIFENRGISKDLAAAYINADKLENISDPSLFGEPIFKAKERLKQAIEKEEDIFIIVDSDCDGYTSSATLANFLLDLEPDWAIKHLDFFFHEGKEHGLADCAAAACEKDVHLVICPDSASGDFEEHKLLKEKGIDCIILDHHEADKVSEDAIVVNNQTSDYPNKNLSGAGVTWQFCRLMARDYPEKNIDIFKYMDLAAVGNAGDMMSIANLETRTFINLGLANPKNPFLLALMEKNKFFLKGKLNYKAVSFSIAPFINAIVRSGTEEEKHLIFKAMIFKFASQEVPSTKRGHAPGDTEVLCEQATRVATNVKNRQNAIKKKSVEYLEELISKNNMLDHKALVFTVAAGEIEKNVAGLVANQLASAYKRPCIILIQTKEDPEVYAGSARGDEVVGVANFKDLCEKSNLTTFQQGHQGAFGIGLEIKNYDAFVEFLDNNIDDSKDAFETEVDFIFDVNDVDPNLILQIGALEDLWGKGIPEPLIVIENVFVSNANLNVYKNRGTTLNIRLENGVQFIKFRASETEENDFTPGETTNAIKVNILGTCNVNEYNGSISPQIQMLNYEVMKNKYIF